MVISGDVEKYQNYFIVAILLLFGLACANNAHSAPAGQEVDLIEIMIELGGKYCNASIN